jgi:hypothetical protein
MAYLFGDSTPSDLQIDYIEFLRDALEFSVQVLGADERMRAGSERALEVRRAGDAEAARLEALAAAQAKAIEGFDAGDADSATAQCAHALLRGGAEVVRAASERVRVAVAADLARIEDDARRDRERCSEALAVFLKRHDLPQMTSELRLQQQNGTGYAARLYVRGLGDLRAVLDLEIPFGHVLAAVARVERIMERLEVQAPESGGWLRKEVKQRAHRLDKEFITALVTGGGETTIHLRSAPDGSGVGYDLIVRDRPGPVSLHRIGEAGELPPFDLDETDSAKVRELKDKLLAVLAEQTKARKALVEAVFGETPLSEHKSPRMIVERLVASMAPVVQEIGKRSLAPGELVLKRQVGGGRREEIFVSRSDLRRKLRGLSEGARAVFAPLGLGDPTPDDEPPATLVGATEPQAGAKVEERKSAKSAVEKSLFAEALAADEPPTKPSAPPPPPREREAMRIDDSLDRLIVSEADVSKPE